MTLKHWLKNVGCGCSIGLAVLLSSLCALFMVWCFLFALTRR